MADVDAQHTGPALSGSSTPGTSSDEEGSEEDYGQPIPCNAERVTDSEDDVPLAQRIPTALEAQRSMRQQFREERDKRRRERALKAEVEAAIMSAPPQTVLSSSQEAALIAASRPPSGRSRTRTLPSNTPRPFAPEDLARKLQDFQVAESSNLQRASTSRAEVPRGRTRTMDEAHAAPHTQRFVPTSTSPIDETASRVLRTMRSFHRPNAKPSEETLQRPSTADSTSSRLGRALSRARSRVRGEEAAPPSAWQGPPLPSSRVSLEASPPVPPLPQPRMSGGEPPRKLSKGSFPAIVLGKKTSMELERSPKPLAQVTSSINSNINIKTQQRIFICDMQRFNVVEIDNSTNADDVVNMIRNQGSLPVNGLVGHEDWMLFEVAQDFGLERPLRGYELLSDVQASWNKDKLVNMFVLKLTPLAKPLSLEATPSSAPTHGGYVEWECKKGKWSKRWLRLREHGLWLSKRDNGKDEVFLCSLSNFDAYTVTRGYNKAPKPFAFAIKSTDNLTYFENKADYLHMFSCQARDGHKWIEKILVARSYVLHQERHVLFSSRANINGGSSRVGNAPAGPLANAGIRKVRTMQPLVNLAPADVFEPGSLLSKT
ncbi:hypothetical protein F5887DRAFT_878644 [Amanita rubescens]|nr:hypothetical protein F5887DRAFT_878644 [Amanita rubescens]